MQNFIFFNAFMITGILLGGLLLVLTKEKEEISCQIKVLTVYKSWLTYVYGLIYGSILLVLYIKFGLNLDFVKFAVLTWFLIVISIKDIRAKTISNVIILILLIGGLIFLIFTMDGPHIITALVTPIIMFAIMSLIAFLSKGSFGMGDVKLLSVIAIYIGSIGIFNTLFFSTFLAGLYCIGLLVIKKADRNSTIPFAPFVTLGLLLTIITS